MARPRLLDLFCGAGGAAMGYHRAGFDVVGVDIRPQPHYPFEFIQGDALEYVAELGHEFEAIHASPPCQVFSRGRKVARGPGTTAEDLIEPTRMLLRRSGRPYAIENVPGAPLKSPVVLCGSMFGLDVRRHRLFEVSGPPFVYAPGPCRHREQGRPVGVYHRMGDQVQGIDHSTGQRVLGGKTADTVEEAQDAMGIDWMTWREITQAIPPAYTEWVGSQLAAAL